MVILYGYQSDSFDGKDIYRLLATLFSNFLDTYQPKVTNHCVTNLLSRNQPQVVDCMHSNIPLASATESAFGSYGKQ